MVEENMWAAETNPVMNCLQQFIIKVAFFYCFLFCFSIICTPIEKISCT